MLSSNFRMMSRIATTMTKKPTTTITISRRGAGSARPMSPHLTIYKFRINMITSVMFRGTGIVMTGGMFALALQSFVAKRDYKYYVYQLQQYPIINAIVKFGVAFPLTYHYFGGLRHLGWDNLIGLNVKSANQSGYAALAVAGAVGVAAMFTEAEAD